MTGFTLHRLHTSIGVEVRGLDLSAPMPDDTCRALSRALIDHLILLFRDQDLTPKAQRAFCEQFGDLGGRLRKAEERPEGRDAENIMLVTNVREKCTNRVSAGRRNVFSPR